MTPRLALPLLFSLLLFTFLPSCRPEQKDSTPPPPPPVTEAASDIPVLPVKKGDRWIYQVQVEIPSGITGPDAPAVHTSHEQTRTYLGKISPAQGLPEVDTFEIIAPNTPTEHELVEILPDRILMRGSVIIKPETTRPFWMNIAVPFFIAGIKPGTALPSAEFGTGAMKRKIQIVAREDLTVPAGTFSCFRILMSGSDGDMEVRRTTWFSPGTGIIAEEKTRYRANKILFRESQKLKETTVSR